MGREPTGYHPEEDQYRDYRCVCLHLNRDHTDDCKGACEWAHSCGCGRFLPVLDPETGNVRGAA